MAEERGKPLPLPDPVSRGFWEGCSRGELRVQRCRACSGLQFYPRAHCTRCASLDVEWVAASGRGTVYSYTVIRRHQAPWWVKELPYLVAIVELEEGPRLLTNLVGVDPAEVRIGRRVQVTFLPTDDEEIRLPAFSPA